MNADVTRNLVTVCVALTSAFVVQSMLLVAIPLSALALGASPLTVGSLLSLPYLLPLIFAIPLGGAVTRIGGRSVIIAGAGGMVLGPLALVLLPGYAGLLVCQMLVGLAQILMVLSAQSIIAGLGRGKALERYFGWYATCLSGGQLLGPLLVGSIIDHNGLAPAYEAMAAIAVISLLAPLWLVGSARTGRAVSRQALSYRAQGRLLRSNSGVQISIATTVAVMFALGAHGSFLPVYLESMAVSATTIGAIVSLRAFSAMSIRPFMAPVIELLGGRARAMVISIVLAGIAISLTGFTDNIIVLGALAVLLGIGSGVSQPLSMVVLAEHVTESQRAGALGMRLMGNRGVQFLAPLMLGLLAELAGFTVTFLVAGVMVFVLLALVVFLVAPFRQLEAATGQQDTPDRE